MSTRHRAIAIDGPSGAGKSTLAGRLARELGYRHVDTGAIYRAIGLAASRAGLRLEDAGEVADLLPRIRVEMRFDPDGGQRMYLNGEDVTGAIRHHAVSAWASAVSAVPAVRDYLMEMQRAAAREQDVIMDGRDIGTVVLPGADLKIFLTAAPEDRARRRCLELAERGEPADEAEILRDVIARDERDSRRAIAPLRQAPDAVVADTTGMSQEEGFQLLRSLVERHLGKGGGGT